MNYVRFFQDFGQRVPSVREYVFIGGQGFPGSLSFEDLMASDLDPVALEAAKAAVRPDDLIMIIYTSGTTGQPKGAALSHRSQLASARAEDHHIQLTEDDLVPMALPFNHVSGITCGILASLLAKATVVLVPIFDCRRHPPNLPGVRTHHLRRCAHHARPADDEPPVRRLDEPRQDSPGAHRRPPTPNPNS